MNYVLALRAVMREEKLRQRQKTRAAVALARAAASAEVCDCMVCQARREGRSITMSEVVAFLEDDSEPAAHVADAITRRH